MHYPGKIETMLRKKISLTNWSKQASSRKMRQELLLKRQCKTDRYMRESLVFTLRHENFDLRSYHRLNTSHRVKCLCFNKHRSREHYYCLPHFVDISLGICLVIY